MRHARTRAAGPRAGFSLVELAVAGTVLFLLLGAMGLIWERNDAAYRNGSSAALLELRVGTAMDRIVGELASATFDSIAPDPTPGLNTDTVTYVPAVGFADGELLLDPPRRIRSELEATETDDGLDEDGDGLADERCVVLTVDVGGAEQRVVLVSGVAELAAGELANGLDDDGDGRIDEPGFFVEREGESLVVHLSLQDVDANGTLMTRSARSAIQVRN